MEGSHYFYILLLVACFVFLSVDFFGLQEMFEVWYHIVLRQIKKCLPVFIETDDGYYQHPGEPTF